jgi:hypothetical protein
MSKKLLSFDFFIQKPVALQLKVIDGFKSGLSAEIYLSITKTSRATAT